MDLGDELLHNMQEHNLFTIKVFGFGIPVTDTVIVMWGIMAVLTIIAIVFTRKMKLIPEGKQNFIEFVVQSLNTFTETSVGHHWRHFAPYLGTMLMFLLVSNTVSIFNIIPEFQKIYEYTHWSIFKYIPTITISPPTKNINVTSCMAVMSILMVLGSGIRFKKISGWLKGFLKPIPMVFPMKILEYAIRPISLSLRLFGNILGSFIIMELIYMAFPIVVPAVFSLYFDLFDGILQAYVFVFLTALYIGEAIE